MLKKNPESQGENSHKRWRVKPFPRPLDKGTVSDLQKLSDGLFECFLQNWSEKKANLLWWHCKQVRHDLG